MKKEILLFFPIFLFVSCFTDDTPKTANVKQNEIYQEYDLIWNNSGQEWNADARFRWRNADSEPMQLTPPSRVTINGQEMEWSENLFMSNSYSRSGKTGAKRFTFHFADTDGHVYINTIPFTPIEFDTVMTAIARFEDLRIPLSRDVQPDEVIEFHMADTTDSFTDPIMIGETSKDAYVRYDATTHCLHVSESYFHYMDYTGLQLWMTCHKQMPLTSGTRVGGKMTLSYTSKTLFVERTW